MRYLIVLIAIFLLMPMVSAVSVTITPEEIGEGDTVTILISDLPDGRVFALRMESAIELHGRSDFTYQANAVAIPFGLNTPRITLVASPVTRAGIEASDGDTVKGMTRLGSGTVTISESLGSIPAGTIDLLKATGIAEADADSVHLALELSGTKTGPASGEITFGITGVSDGHARIIVLVDGNVVNDQLVTIGSPVASLPSGPGVSAGADGDTVSAASLDGKVRLLAEPGSVSGAGAKDLRIIQADLRDLPTAWEPLSGAYSISPGSVLFTSPATISFAMNGDPGAPFIARYDGGEWQIIPSRIEGSNLVAGITEGGQYAMMSYPPDPPAAEKSAGGLAPLVIAGLAGLLLLGVRRRR
ncbi:hypothetical protein J2T58_002166 [Methanocalculus alkaliphilus]|uniref:hypothetical protein n=1 Tax=Methanocalculus alkaliphilus TaxID=768730 RepID=UPI0020A22646|nr:hypothetical protein [Methanocalculus alkaliphilus]MCP1716290.1 hypothetical protein [Methanocalculus alkaliphilus]